MFGNIRGGGAEGRIVFGNIRGGGGGGGTRSVLLLANLLQ